MRPCPEFYVSDVRRTPAAVRCRKISGGGCTGEQSKRQLAESLKHEREALVDVETGRVDAHG
jgi:hypothetical protein